MPRIGTAGWSLSARPEEAGSHLLHYARALNCAEINTTFYRAHRAATWTRWASETPADFRFSVKAPKTITHEAKLRASEPLLRAFLGQLKPIAPKLGPLLFQLPPSLAFDWPLADDFFALVRSMFHGEVATEARHASWFSAEAGELLFRHSIACVAADPAKAAPEAAEPGGDPSLVYYRLHGSPRMYYSNYEDQFLASLAARVRGTKNAWIVFDNTAHGNAFPNAVCLRQLVESDTL